MQRKLEQLPGLSNVTGKYTKKCTDEPYPRLFVRNTSEESSGFHNSDVAPPVWPLNATKSSIMQPRLDSANSHDYVPVTHKCPNIHVAKPQYVTPKSSTAHQSLISSGPNTSSGGKVRPQKSNIPIKPQDMQRTKRYMKEVVKSSSSGSVSALQSKPTGVIIATPCSPQVNEQGLTRSFDGFSVSGKVASFNSFSGSEESFHRGSERTSFLSGKDFSQRLLPGPCIVSGYSYETEDGILSTREHSRDRSSYTQPSNLLNVSKNSPGGADSQHCSKRFSDDREAYQLGDEQLCSRIGRVNLSDNEPAVSPMHISSDSSLQSTEQHISYSGNQEKQDTSELNRKPIIHLCGLQPRHTSWNVGFSNIGELPDARMPGSQCTQNALEHYLSDLVADEQKMMASSPCAGVARGYCETTSGYMNPSVSPKSGENEKKTCSTDLLQFLEQRIENALRSMTSVDSKPYPPNSTQNRMRPNRSASLNPVCDSRIKGVESSSVAGNLFQNQRTFENNDSQQIYSYENSAAPPNRQHISSFSDERSSHAYAESNVLQQFNFDELQYLLKSVRDLLALRAPSAYTNVSLGQDGSKITELDKPRKYGKTERNETMSNRDDQSMCAESPYIARSLSSSRSSSAVRNNRFETTSESRGSRLSSGISEDGSHSNADLMHQRLPIGFQHFERYLDSKFGPDHPTNNAFTNSSDVQPKPESCAKIIQTSSGHSPSVLSGNSFDHNSHMLTKQKPPSSIPMHLGTTQTGIITTNKSEETVNHSSRTPVPQYPDHLNEGFRPVYTNFQSDYSEQTEWNSEEKLTVTSEYCNSMSNQPGLATHSHNSGCVSVPFINHSTSSHTGNADGNANHMNYCTESNNIYAPDPQQGQVTSWPPNWYQWYISSHMFPQRHPSYSQFPYHHYYYPHLKQQQQFGLDHTVFSHRMNRLVTPLSYVMNSPPNYSPAGHFCCMEPNHAHVYEGNCTSPLAESCHFVSYDPQTTENPLQATAASGLCSCANPDGIKRFANINYTYSDRIPTNSYAAYRPSGVYSPPPGYPWFPCMNTVRWDPFSYNNNNNLENYNWNAYFQRPTYGRFTNCMPRSGSANAGFTYSSETDNLSNHTSERGVASELDRFKQNSNRCEHYYAVNPSNQVFILSDQTNDAQNFFHHNNNNGNNVLQSPALRSMTNSFSANDLAAYHNQSRIGIRYTKSSFDLAPELPVEPGLALMDRSNFYSKISSLIEMDNNSRLILPNGWSERRSGLGRSYYTCDSTRRSTWNHPLIGPYIPLGWERVDSSQSGVYYQNLLIPHCQRHHPNLWINAPLKDPEVERKSFFTDLRKLQLSLRHNLLDCHSEVGAYKNANSEQEQYFISRFRYLKLESLMEMIYGLDQLFYQDLHALVVSFEQERMSVVSHMFAIRPPEKTFPQFTDP
ncbi:unnamed protein product [Schistosoma rodhaini]|uniref:WW domain-containing protein n=1 Tax=Schistosoma rodhaini TaxID=6188 RepID=A0AA85F6X9_9TREM|nr:unnamed protein product [Schistosoma rodhaini]